MRRLQAIDSLLPPSVTVTAGCGARFAVPGGTGSPAAVAVCEHKDSEPGTLDRTWGGAERRFQLTISVAGPDCDAAVDEVLARWREHLAELPEASDPDTAAVVSWPSRDVTGINALLRHGLAPRAVVAARRAGSLQAETPAPTGVSIRRARPADAAVLTDLGMELIRYDAQFGAVTLRPESARVLGEETVQLLAGDDPWAWLAERDGEPVGMLSAEQPEQARWIAPMTALSPVAYLLMMVVAAGERGGGIGGALAAAFHATARDAGVPLILLHYAQVNPLSAPFWSQQGYRPLWTSWEARPASSLS